MGTSDEPYGLEPAIPPTARLIDAPAAAKLATDDVPCLRCGYNLHGLSADRACPECGTPISRSLQGNLLIYSSPEYVASLHRGLICILIAVVLMLGLMVCALLYGFSMAAAAATPARTFAAALSLLGLGIAALALVGWWMFSAPDPAILGNDTGDTPRKVVRVTVLVNAGATLLTTAAALAPVASEVVRIAGAGMQLAASIAGIVQFFASMMYVKWLAPRLANPSNATFIANRAKTYMWLLPVIYVVGFVCMFLGPLIAMVLYYLLLNRVRLELRTIRERQVNEGLTTLPA